MIFECGKCQSQRVTTTIGKARFSDEEIETYHCEVCGNVEIDGVKCRWPFKIIDGDPLNTLPKDKDEKVKDLIREGKSIRTIMEEADVAKGTVETRIKKLVSEEGIMRPDEKGYHTQKTHGGQFKKKENRHNENAIKGKDPAFEPYNKADFEDEKTPVVPEATSVPLMPAGTTALLVKDNPPDSITVHLPFPSGRAIKDTEYYHIYQYDDEPHGREVSFLVSIENDGSRLLDGDAIEHDETGVLEHETAYEYWMFLGEVAQEIKRLCNK